MRVFFAVRLNRQTDEQGRSAAWGRSPAGYRASDELETVFEGSVEVEGSEDMVAVALNKVFAGTNHGSGVEFDGYKQRSVSIGDVISIGGVGGVAFAVAGVGFDRLGYDRELGLDGEEVTA